MLTGELTGLILKLLRRRIIGPAIGGKDPRITKLAKSIRFRAQPYKALYQISSPSPIPKEKFRDGLRSSTNPRTRLDLFAVPSITRNMSINVNMREVEDIVETPRKRLKTDNVAAADDVIVSAVPTEGRSLPANAQTVKEAEVGITEFVSRDNEGFSGILKKRYVLQKKKKKKIGLREYPCQANCKFRPVLGIPISW